MDRVVSISAADQIRMSNTQIAKKKNSLTHLVEINEVGTDLFPSWTRTPFSSKISSFLSLQPNVFHKNLRLIVCGSARKHTKQNKS